MPRLTSTWTSPGAPAAGATHCTSSELTARPGTTSSPKRHATSPCIRPRPRITTGVPPDTGPASGCTASISTAEVYS